jgi:hypothetical protein
LSTFSDDTNVDDVMTSCVPHIKLKKPRISVQRIEIFIFPSSAVRRIMQMCKSVTLGKRGV